MATQQRRLSKTNETINEIQKAVVNFTIDITDNIMGRFPVFNDTLKLLEAATGLKKRYIAIALASCPFLLIGALFFAPLFLTVISSIYPIYMSVKAIEQEPNQRTRWLIYWFIFNTLSVIEIGFGMILAFIPGYALIKSIFLAWCMIPSDNNGCVIAYYVLQPFLSKPIQYADEYLNDAALKLKNVVHENEGLAAAATLTANIVANNNNAAATSANKLE